METTIAPAIGAYWQWRNASISNDSIANYSIYYVRAGERQGDRPPFLLVHGFGASTDHWRKNIAELSQDFEVWAIDLLGFGRSEKPNIEFSATLWRNQLHDFITEVIGQPVVLAGNSIGGYVSLCVAAQRPESAVGLVLLNCAGGFTPEQVEPPIDPIRQGILQLIRSIALSPLPNWFLFQYFRQKSVIRKTLTKVYVDQRAVTDRLVEEIYRPSCDPGAAQVFAAVFKSPPGEKIDRLLQQMHCPLLMLWGEGDPWIKSRERGAKFREYYGNLTEYYLNAGHCPHDEIPDQVDRLMRAWSFALSAQK